MFSDKKRTNQAKRNALIATALLDLQQAPQQLDQLLKQYHFLLLEYQSLLQIHEIDRQIYNLAKADYNEAKISPAHFLPKEKVWLEQGLVILRKEMELKRLETDVLIFASSK